MTYQQQAPEKRKPFPLAMVIVLAVIAAACGILGLTLSAVSSDKAASESVAPIVLPETTPTPVTAKKTDAAVRSWSDGTWAVGTDIKPGTYVTTAREDGCYWARLKDFEGSLDSIISNGNLDKGAHGRVTIKKTDKGAEFSGGCVWMRA